MKKRLLSIIIALIFIAGLLSLNVSADSLGMRIIFLDATTLETINLYGDVIYQGDVAFQRPDGSSFVVKGFWGDPYEEGAWGFTVGYLFDYYTQSGLYSLKSYPIPNEYETVEIYSEDWDGRDSSGNLLKKKVKDGFTVSETTTASGSDFSVSVLSTNIYIVVRKIKNLAATPTASTVLVNGKNVAFDAYNINGNNYFKLRDLAYVLNGTEKQFEVGYDNATKAITLASSKTYTSVGGEMSGKGAGNKTPTATTSKIYLDGKEITLTAYNIDGNNYFKLRDIGEAFDFGVDWDAKSKTIVIDTSKGYTPE